MKARPEMLRPTTAARIDPPGGDEDQGTDEGEVHDEDSLPPSDGTPPRDEMESAGEREDDVHAPSLPTTSRPEPRDRHHSAGHGEDHNSLPQVMTEVRATPRPGRNRSPGPASPPEAIDTYDARRELSPTLVYTITTVNTGGGSPGEVYVNQRVLQGLDCVGPDQSLDLFSTPTRGEPLTDMGSPKTPHTTPTEEENSPPSPAGPIDTPDISPAGPEGPPQQ